jgi:hypothetical protein
MGSESIMAPVTKQPRRNLMGHRSLRTMQQYAQVNGEATKKAFRAFDRQRSKK